MIASNILIATQNRGKQAEFFDLVSPLGIELFFPQDIPTISEIEVEETGKTFADNAALKAVTFSRITGLTCLADDSGLMIDALEGEPGIYSKRYVPGSDEDRNKAVLSKLSNTPPNKRTARFISMLCLYIPNRSEQHFFSGEVTGTIASEIAAGEYGFGYDPIFIPDGYSQSFSQLPTPTKNSLSHRGRALAKLVTYLKKYTTT